MKVFLEQKGFRALYVDSLEDDLNLLRAGKSDSSVLFWVKLRDQSVGQFRMQALPGCCGVVVCHHAVKDTKSYSAQFRSIKKAVAVELGFSQMIATVEMSNYPAVFSAHSAGYTFLKSFNNSRTGNLITLTAMEL